MSLPFLHFSLQMYIYTYLFFPFSLPTSTQKSGEETYQMRDVHPLPTPADEPDELWAARRAWLTAGGASKPAGSERDVGLARSRRSIASTGE